MDDVANNPGKLELCSVSKRVGRAKSHARRAWGKKWSTDDATSKRMRGVGRENTSVEVTLRRALHALGLRYCLHRRDLPGSPDIVLPRYKAVIFVHGCFWHRHARCKRATMPLHNATAWGEKFKANVKRDRRNRRDLIAAGWRVFVAWGCEIAKDPQSVARTLMDRLVNAEIDR